MFWNVKYPDFLVTVDASNAVRVINSAKRLFDFVAIRLDMPKVYFPQCVKRQKFQTLIENAITVCAVWRYRVGSSVLVLYALLQYGLPKP
jgi:hypothetical protein